MTALAQPPPQPPQPIKKNVVKFKRCTIDTLPICLMIRIIKDYLGNIKDYKERNTKLKR